MLSSDSGFIINKTMCRSQLFAYNAIIHNEQSRPHLQSDQSPSLMELPYWFLCVVFNFATMQIFPHIFLRGNEESKKPDEKEMAFERTNNVLAAHLKTN